MVIYGIDFKLVVFSEIIWSLCFGIEEFGFVREVREGFIGEKK